MFRNRLPGKIPPYTAIAGIYDRIMNHVDYVSWMEYIDSVFSRFHSGVRTVLETASGTGSLAVLLRGRGYEVTCMDVSPEMICIASHKFRESGLSIRTVAGDMSALPFRTRFDAVICLYDSINYLVKPADFRKAVTETASVIESGGLFIFDVCTVRNSELFFRDNSMVDVIDMVEYERICRYDPVERIQENRFIVTRQDGSQLSEIHRQRIYTLEEIGEMIRHAPFEQVGRFDDMSFRSGTENSERVHFVLRRI
jgi:SAM-dependent methyltransferase